MEDVFCKKITLKRVRHSNSLAGGRGEALQAHRDGDGLQALSCRSFLYQAAQVLGYPKYVFFNRVS